MITNQNILYDAKELANRQLWRRLNLTPEWIDKQAEQGKIPSVLINGKRFYHPRAFYESLLRLAGGPGAA